MKNMDVVMLEYFGLMNIDYNLDFEDQSVYRAINGVLLIIKHGDVIR